MGKVLVEASKVTCGHQGSIGMTGAARLVVDGSKVLTTASVALNSPTKTSITGCGNPANADQQAWLHDLDQAPRVGCHLSSCEPRAISCPCWQSRAIPCPCAARSRS